MKTLFLSLFVAISSTVIAQQNELNIGDPAPQFSALTDEGTTWNLADYTGKKYIVVYFYPAAMTGGCTKQACAYRDMKNEIDQAEALVVGVSGDNVEGLKLFKKAYNLNFPLLSDESGEIARKFGVPARNGGTINREIDGVQHELKRGVTTSRWTFIIDKNGKIAYKNTGVDAANDSKEILEFLKKKR